MLNIEKTLVDYLKKVSETYVAIPKDRPDEFISIERVGGSSDSVVIDYPMIVIQCWSDTRVNASELAYKVNKHLGEITQHVKSISSASCNSLYHFPDPSSKHERYQIVYNFVTR